MSAGRVLWSAGALLLGVVLLGGTTACSDPEKVYAGLDIDVVSAAPTRVEIRSDAIELPAGVAVTIAVTPRSSDLPYEERDLVLLESDDDAILDVFAREHPREFVLVGVDPGEACLEVRINHERVDCIDTTVTEQ